jgi:AcrR family transcriptional regulator
MGVQERKAREKAQRHNEILEAARRCFDSTGFLNTTLQDVAREAEVSVGLIYRYFESKEDIFASLALKGAKHFDAELAAMLKRAQSGRKRPDPREFLAELAERFFAFYTPYGEYFDMLMYSYKGMNQEVRIRGTTITRLMSVTLKSLDRLKEYLMREPSFRAEDEDEALRIAFLLWGLLLGSHKLFDGSGRGHVLAFTQRDFLRDMARQVFEGIGRPAVPAGTSRRAERLRPERNA